MASAPDMIRKLAIRHVAYPMAEAIKRWPLRRYLRELHESQWWTPDELRELQDRRLAALVEHAYSTVPFYRDLFDQHGLKPEDVRTVDDLSKLPILTKDTIRAAFPERMTSTAFDANKLVTMSSSGSTGEPFKYYISQDEKARKWAGLFRFWTWCGWEIGDRYALLVAFPLKAFKGSGVLSSLESRFSGVLSIPAFELYKHNAREYVEKLVGFSPSMVRGYASSLHHLAEVMRERGETLHLNAVCSTGETLFDSQRDVIEKAFQTKVYNGYGGEGMEIAGECDHGGMHINAESLILEVVDPDGNRCPPGTLGQVVLTDLNHYSMPFIRYNIQDVASVSEGVCPCGRGLPLIENLSGRLTDVGITPSGKAILAHHFTGLFMKVPQAADSFQVVQERPDLFIISIVPGSGFDEVRESILTQIQEHVGPDVTVDLRVVESIPTTAAGKRRFFISKCGLRAAGINEEQ